jgi:hypothetical protein
VNRQKIVVVVVLVLAAAGLLLLVPNHRAQRAVERTKSELRRQGFKLEFSELDLAAPPELRVRASALLEVGQGGTPGPLRELDPMKPGGGDTAIVAWSQESLPGENQRDIWQASRALLDERREALDAACAAVISGPFRFDAPTAPGGNAPFSYLIGLRSLALMLQARVVVELHEQHQERAWTNLLALTRLVTAWRIEPSEPAYMVRFACVALAERATWEALQSNGWQDRQLAELQREWEGVALLAGLSDTAAFGRASVSAQCRLLRQQAPGPPTPPLQIASDFVSSPRHGWLDLTAGWRESRYRNYGVFEEENELLLFLRDRELVLRRAVVFETWSEMRLLPGVTNMAPLPLSPNSRVQITGNVQRGGGFVRAGLPLLERAADAEARRRLTMAALAIERFRLSRGAYPASLSQFVPGLLKRVPADFMDGQPLRYRRTDDGHFLLYSVGLDCVDDGGQMRREDDFNFRTNAPGRGFGFLRREGPDLVWPIPVKK